MGQFWPFSSLLLTPTTFQERCGEYIDMKLKYIDDPDGCINDILLGLMVIYGGVPVQRFEKHMDADC